MRLAAITPRYNPAAWGPADKQRPRVDPDPLVMLAKAYRNDEAAGLSPDLERAAYEIRRVFRWVSGRLFAKAGNMERAISGGGWRDPSDNELEAYHERYKPWADEMSARGKQTGLPFMEVAIDLCVDSISPNKIDRGRQWRNGRAIVLIREALQRYCEIAGWVRR